MHNIDPSENTNLLSDQDIATLLSLTPSWVRKQRWLRNRKEDHTLTIDPIRIGRLPRYRATDFNEWLESFENGSASN